LYSLKFDYHSQTQLEKPLLDANFNSSNNAATSPKGVCGAVCFGFEVESHMNRKIKKHVVWIDSVNF
jgi:hypothetical protein